MLLSQESTSVVLEAGSGGGQVEGVGHGAGSQLAHRGVSGVAGPFTSPGFLHLSGELHAWMTPGAVMGMTLPFARRPKPQAEGSRATPWLLASRRAGSSFLVPALAGPASCPPRPVLLPGAQGPGASACLSIKGSALGPVACWCSRVVRG